MSELKSTSLDDDQSEPECVQYKVIIVGDGAVGKTSLVLRFADDAFGKQYKQTIGVDFFVKRVMLPQNVEVRLQLWDIGGQSIGAKMLSNYIFGSDAVVFVYDVTNYQSFQNLEDWMHLVKNSIEGTKCIKVLVANKSDLDHLRTVKKDRHEDYADEHFTHKLSFCVSAKTGAQVEPTFVKIAAELAGINLSYNDLMAREKQVGATIVAHPRHDPEYGDVNAEDIKAGRKCAIM
eukprot:GEMP01091955.1.p1 GENE.GEMP01091955.1~~GEMP01091955.1.p1  ORF type:complete len:234 (+),score=52.80 GEMP01091955.1:127-828(+)